MSAPRARLAVVAPGGVPAEVAAPPLTGAAGAEIRDTVALRVDGALVLGACVVTPLPGWVEDMRPPVTARAHAWTAKLAERIVGAPVDVRDVDARGVGGVHAVAGSGERLGSARVMVGFEAGTEPRVLTCGVACARRVDAAAPEAGSRTCEGIVRASHLEGDTPPPPPGAALRGVAWAVHHPSSTTLAAGAFGALGLLALVALRRRPRSRL